MSSSWNQVQEAKSGVSFFTSLRRLCREVDQGVKDIQSKLDVHGLHSGDINRHLALKGLLDRKKDIDTVKLSARTSLREMRNNGSEFEQTLQACSDVIEAQLKQLSNIQAHLMQYGFVPQKEPEEATEEATCDSSTAAVEPPTTPPQQDTTNKEEIEKKCKLTPCLEDFGLSSYTLNMLSRPSQAQQVEFKVPSAAVPQSVGGKAAGRDATMQLDSVPTPFQNRGLTVTPSLFPSQAQCYGTGLNRTTQEAFCLPCTPDMTASMQGSAADRDDCFQSAPAGLAKTLDFSDSPVPPVLHTPGIKQIPRLRDAVIPSEANKDKGSAARQLKLEDANDASNSPVPPVLRTPGIQQISTRSAVEKQQHGIGRMESSRANSQNEPPELPRTPEMTYSLKDLEDMTVSFQNTDLSLNISERSAVATSYSDMLDSTQMGTFSKQRVQCGEEPPPPHQSYVPKAAGTAMLEPQLSSWARDRFNKESVDMPDSPELTMSYTSMARSAASQPAMNVSSQHLGIESRGWRLSVGSHVYNNENTLRNDRADFSSLYSTNTTEKLMDTKTRVLWSRENLSSPCMPELKTGKLDHRVYKSMLPDQPKLQQPSADLPATPKFMGSYHFMGTKD